MAEATGKGFSIGKLPLPVIVVAAAIGVFIVLRIVSGRPAVAAGSGGTADSGGAGGGGIQPKPAQTSTPPTVVYSSPNGGQSFTAPTSPVSAPEIIQPSFTYATAASTPEPTPAPVPGTEVLAFPNQGDRGPGFGYVNPYVTVPGVAPITVPSSEVGSTPGAPGQMFTNVGGTPIAFNANADAPVAAPAAP